MSGAPEFDLIERCLKAANFDTQSKRIFHGRGHCYPGFEHVCIDWFEPALVVTLFNDTGELWEKSFLSWLQSVASSSHSIYVQRRYRSGPLYEHYSGPVLNSLYARRGELKFALQLSNQNIGFFLDIEPARCWLERQCKDKKVLNLFSYTCSFSLVASAAGARSVLNMDLSSKSLSLGRASYHESNISLDGVQFFANDILKSWSRIKRFGPYDTVIIDPPSFQKGSFIEHKDYAKVLRRIEQFTSSGANVLCCLNSPEVSADAFQARLDQNLTGFTFVEQLRPSVDFPNKESDRALKMFVYQKNG